MKIFARSRLNPVHRMALNLETIFQTPAESSSLIDLVILERNPELRSELPLEHDVCADGIDGADDGRKADEPYGRVEEVEERDEQQGLQGVGDNRPGRREIEAVTDEGAYAIDVENQADEEVQEDAAEKQLDISDNFFRNLDDVFELVEDADGDAVDEQDKDDIREENRTEVLARVLDLVLVYAYGDKAPRHRVKRDRDNLRARRATM